jgi:hypothetical protein
MNCMLPFKKLEPKLKWMEKERSKLIRRQLAECGLKTNIYISDIRNEIDDIIFGR